MKKTLLFTFIVISSLFYACSGEDNESTGCGTVSNLTIEQQSDKINFSVTGDSALYYEISAIVTGSGTNPDYGHIESFNNPNGTIDALGLGTNNYLFYARTACDENHKGKWFGPITFEVQQYCETPRDLEISQSGFYWSSYPISGEEYSNFQVEYGPQGFAHGTGTLATVNSSSYYDFSLAGGQNYDFYVRAYCKNNVGYGNWAGPVSYFAQTNINMCTAPTNVSYEVESNNGSTAIVNFDWTRNGEDKFEYTLVRRNLSIQESGINTIQGPYTPTITGIDIDYDYDFYVRAVCTNGNKTTWTKKQLNF